MWDFFFSIRKLYAKSRLQGFKESVKAYSLCVNQSFSLEVWRGKILQCEKLIYGNKL